jgi:hypothetical protein
MLRRNRRRSRFRPISATVVGEQQERDVTVETRMSSPCYEIAARG